jgi:hypothetical protein
MKEQTVPQQKIGFTDPKALMALATVLTEIP